MPRFYFNVSGARGSLDREGSELADAPQARCEGMRLMAAILSIEAGRPILGAEWRVEVTDHLGMVLFRIELTIDGSVAPR